MKKGPMKLKTGAAKQLVLNLYASGDFTIDGACREAGHTRSAHQSWITRDSKYRDDFKAAKEMRVEVLEDEAYRRAKVGAEKPVFYCGKQVGKIREFSDVLLMFLLKAAEPAKYRERHVPELPKGQSVEDMLREMAMKHGLTDDDEGTN